MELPEGASVADLLERLKANLPDSLPGHVLRGIAISVNAEYSTAGHVLRGHEFHYARVVAQPDQPLAEIRDAAGTSTAETGGRRGLVTGSFFHMVDAAEESRP